MLERCFRRYHTLLQELIVLKNATDNPVTQCVYREIIEKRLWEGEWYEGTL